MKEKTENSLDGCEFIAGKSARQERDTYLEVPEMDEGYYWIYIEMEWQPNSFRLLEGDLQYSINCYGESDVEFSGDMSRQFEQVEVLDKIMTAYADFHIANDTGVVKLSYHQDKNESSSSDDSYKKKNGIQVIEEANYWNTGY